VSKGKVIAVIGTLFAIYMAAAPYITVRQMQSAAERHDAEALSEYIDFPSVRQSLKDQINAMLMNEVTKAPIKGNPFAALGTAFGGAIVDKMVDTYVTPAGITQLMAGVKPKPTEDGSPTRERLYDSSMSYASLNKFVVKVKSNAGVESILILRRRGIGWKLTEIVIR
jgi:hypothetical protein